MDFNLSQQTVTITAPDARLQGDLTLPAAAQGIVLFAHGSGSNRHSPRNRSVAQALNQAGLATLLIDLLTEEEERIDLVTRQLRFDIQLLAARLITAISWLRNTPSTRLLPIGLFGASTGAAAALVAASVQQDAVQAVVSRGGRPDLAGQALPFVKAPTLLIVGGDDVPVIGMNREAIAQMHALTRLEIVSGATHLFEEPGALETLAKFAIDWFLRYLVTQPQH